MGKRYLTLGIALAALTAAPLALADHSSNRRAAWARADHQQVRHAQRSHYDYARVLGSEPIVRYVTVTVPRRECWDEEVSRERRNYRRGDGSVAGATIAGGLIGGVLGRQIGGGSGRDAMTVVGTLVGSAIANDKANRRARNYDEPREVYTETVRRCEVHDEVREEERIDGYRVTYEYNGREYTTRTARDPGERIRVRVDVARANRY